MSLSVAEQKVRKLARDPANCTCANCGTYKKFGFGTVCIKFHTFVCNNCKSSHQAISHRCKSLTMSSWTDAEVAELEQKGNDFARRTWLKNAPPVGSGGRPKEGDDVNVFKRFVVEVYENRRFYGEDNGGHAAPAASSHSVAFAVPASTPSSKSAPSLAWQTLPKSPAPPVRTPAPVAPAVGDLLDFASPIPAPAATTPVSANFANFDAFDTSTPVPVSNQTLNGNIYAFSTALPSSDVSAATVKNSSSSSFSFISPPPVAAKASEPSSFSFIQAPTPSPAATGFDAFADFSGMTTPAQVNPTSDSTRQEQSKKSIMGSTPKPVMGNMALNEKGSLISSMELPRQNMSKEINITGNQHMMSSMQQQQQQPTLMQQQQHRIMMAQQQYQVTNNWNKEMPMYGGNMMSNPMQMNAGMTMMMNNNNSMQIGAQNPMQQMNAQMMMQQQMMQMNLGGGMQMNNSNMMGGTGMNGNWMNQVGMNMGGTGMDSNLMSRSLNGGNMKRN